MNLQDAPGAVLLAIFLVLFAVGLGYRMKSQATGETLDRRQEGLFIARHLGARDHRGAGYGAVAFAFLRTWRAFVVTPCASS